MGLIVLVGELDDQSWENIRAGKETSHTLSKLLQMASEMQMFRTRNKVS